MFKRGVGIWGGGEEYLLMKNCLFFFCLVCPLAECAGAAANGECDVS